MVNQTKLRLGCLAALLLPGAALAVVAVEIATGRTSGAAAGSLAAMYVLTLLGIDVGFHRHFTHRAFKAHPVLRHLLAMLGSMAFQGSIVWWSGVHRRHHRFSDRPGDPHSPRQGFWHAHFGWLLDAASNNPPHWARQVKDLLRDPLVRRAHRLYYFYVLLGLALPAAAVGLVEQSARGVFDGLVWGGLCRILLVNQAIWAVNSVCHRHGGQPFRLRDDSRNSLVLMLPTLGFSLHNNHHAFPAAACNSHAWWQIDTGGALIRLLGRLGLAWEIGRPSAAEIAVKRRPPELPRPAADSAGSEDFG